MARSSTPVRNCPSCASPLVEISLGAELTLRSCSRCDTRWWLRSDQPTNLQQALSAVADHDKGRRLRAVR